MPEIPGSSATFPSQRRLRRGLYLLGTTVGLGLIGLWIAFWVASSRQNCFLVGQSSWVPAMEFLAGDFRIHLDSIARYQAAGIDPYHKFDDWVCVQYPYPPMVSRPFLWVAWFDSYTSSRIWQVGLGVLLTAGGVAAWRSRQRLGLDSIPLTLIVGLILFSTPAMFAMERGQCDPLIILPMIVAAWLLRRKSFWADLAVGSLLGLTAWIKYYPGLTVVALVVLGRRKAVVAFVGVVALIGVIDFDGFRESVRHGQVGMAEMAKTNWCVYAVKHSIIENWPLFGFVKSTWLVRIPGFVVSVGSLVPAVLLVSWKVSRSARPDAVAFPYLLWLTALATFALPYSIDYNLATLPIATLAVWDRRDRVWVHLAILASVAWSQPFWLPIDGEIIFGLKLGALYGVGACVAARAWEIREDRQTDSKQGLFRPAFARIRTISGATVPGSIPP